MVLADPLKANALQKGLVQLSEEGATQVLRPLARNNLVLGAVGRLQLDVVAWRLEHEHGVQCRYEPLQLAGARWVQCEDVRLLRRFRDRNEEIWRSTVPITWCCWRPRA